MVRHFCDQTNPRQPNVLGSDSLVVVAWGPTAKPLSNKRRIHLRVGVHLVFEINPVMELQEFITRTLVEIIKGVEGAQKGLGDTPRIVNPELHKVFSGSTMGGTNLGLGWAANGSGLVTMVQFDVSITAQEGQGTKGGIGVVAGIFALGSQGASEKARRMLRVFSLEYLYDCPLPEFLDSAVW